MEWLTDIIKKLEISRLLVSAVFVTSVVMYFGPTLTPNNTPRVPEDFLPALFGLMVLTGCLLIFWAIAEAWIFITKGVRKTTQAFKNGSLSDAEIAILHVLGRDPTTPLDLSTIDYSATPATKLEFHHIASGLEEKGLVYINGFDENLVSLTKLGRDKALDLHRERKAKSGAK